MWRGHSQHPVYVLPVRRSDRTKTVTHQVNEVTEVLLDLLRRQTPHQVQGTVQLLVILKDNQQRQHLLHSTISL